jgi:hypothetical protein
MPRLRFADSAPSRSWNNGEVHARVHQRRRAIRTLEREFIDLLTLGVKDQGAGFVERRVSVARRLLRLHSLVGIVDCTYEF